MRLVFFGTPDFALPTLRRLLDGPHRVVLVVTQPDRPRGRGRRLSESPVAALAREAGVATLKPERVSEPGVLDALDEVAPDLGVVVAYGQFLGRRVRQAPRLGYLINAHASLLPRHRGASPIQHAILCGEQETGISVMRVEREMDAGPVALQLRTAIEPDEDAGSLSARLADLAAKAVARTVDAIAAGRVHWTAQDDAGASDAPRIERADALLDWSQPAAALVRRVRAMAPEPGAFTRLDGQSLRVLAASAEPGAVHDPPGTVRVAEGRLRVATADGWLLPRVLQRPGGRPLDVEAFQRGRAIPDGAHLGA